MSNHCDMLTEHKYDDLKEEVKYLKQQEEANTLFRLRIQGGLSVVSWTGIVSIALYFLR